MENERKKRRKALGLWSVVLIVAVLLSAGAGAAIKLGYFSQLFASSEEAEPATPKMKRRELALGRIVANLRGSQLTGVTHLILDPVIAYDVAADSPISDPGIEPLKAAMRDAVIDYLAGVSVDEISGSAGLATLRAEVLRRARVVTGNDSPQAVLLQEYILQ